MIDGRTASHPGGPTYGVFEVGQQVVPGQTTVLPYTIWMPALDTEHAVTIPSPTTTEVVVTNPGLPGFELRIPPGTVITDHEHKPVTQVSLTPIPLDRPPFPLPPYQDFPVFMTIQPGAGYVYNAQGRGARVIYPNLQGSAPGDRWNFWHYDPEGRGWYVYGHGHVSPDGRQAVPDPGVEVYEFTATVANCCDGGPPKGPRGGERDGDPPLRRALGGSRGRSRALGPSSPRTSRNCAYRRIRRGFRGFRGGPDVRIRLRRFTALSRPQHGPRGA